MAPGVRTWALLVFCPMVNHHRPFFLAGPSLRFGIFSPVLDTGPFTVQWLDMALSQEGFVYIGEGKGLQSFIGHVEPFICLDRVGLLCVC